MDVANMLSHDPPRPLRPHQAADHTQFENQKLHQYPTRHSVVSNNMSTDNKPLGSPQNNQTYSPMNYSLSPTTPTPKNIAFELLFDGGASYRARLPMRVQIFPHDTTDSIVTTVKNFYGLYEGAAKGVSFEDDRGNTLIARYENFRNDMIVYVRVIPDYSQAWQPHEQVPAYVATSISPHRTAQLDAGFHMPPPQPAQILSYGQPISRPSSRIARKQSTSPRLGRIQRSVSQKGRSHSAIKSREDSIHAHSEDANNDAMRGYSSSDGEGGSVTSSRKARNEQLATAEISLENIVEGGRRQRAKFESSELPLFVPPQVPAANSISSISPQRRSNGQDNPSPFARPNQRIFSYGQPLQSPQSHGFVEHTYGIVPANGNTTVAPATAQHGHRLRDRSSAPGLSARLPAGIAPRVQGYGILPTPDPTIASCISDEDVALQLMRLGDASNISHGRTSASTLDDAVSGRAEIASSATSDSDDESEDNDQPSLPQPTMRPKLEASPALQPSKLKKQYKHLNDGLPSMESTDPSSDEADGDFSYDGKKDGVFQSDPDDLVNEFGQSTKRPKLSAPKIAQGCIPKVRGTNSSRKNTKPSKSRPSGVIRKIKPSLLSKTGPAMSPPSLPPQSRKASVASTMNPPSQPGGADEDLSTKPRCQRCRKSKKGCDRQRPCQRCQDAGIGAEGCISEDEGNGRKGRFGRHMGVSVKLDSASGSVGFESEEAGAILDGMASGQEKSKKRKRQ